MLCSLLLLSPTKGGLFAAFPGYIFCLQSLEMTVVL